MEKYINSYAHYCAGKVNKMDVTFGTLKINGQAKKHFSEIFKTHWATQGPKVKQFEEEWGRLFGYKHNAAMANGTCADIAACMALYDFGAKRGDEIIAPACAFAAVGNSILAAGFNPVFVDIERETLNINPKKIEEKITPKTKAIMAVHTMGKPCEMDTIIDIAHKHNLHVIEDACEAHGAKYKDKFVGHWGDMATFSYYAAHLICAGEGGMVSTNNEQLAPVLRSVRTHGRRDNDLYFDHVRPGLNLRMNDMEAAVGLSSIASFWKIFNKRKRNLNYLLKKTKDLKDFAFFNSEGPNESVTAHAFSITVKKPELNAKELEKFLVANGVQCKRNFGSMPTQHAAFSFMGHKLGDFPESAYVGDNGIHVGIHHGLTKEHLNYVSDLLHQYFGKFVPQSQTSPSATF